MSEDNLEAFRESPKYRRDELRARAMEFRAQHRGFYENPHSFTVDKIREQLAAGNTMAMNNFMTKVPGGFWRWWPGFVENVGAEKQQLFDRIDAAMTELGIDIAYVEELARQRCYPANLDPGLDLELQLTIFPAFELLIERGVPNHDLMS